MSGTNTLRGQAVIIVNKHFKLKRKRKGAAKDYNNLMTLFYELGFHVKLSWNASADRMKEIVQDAARDDVNKNSECFVLVISSHGTETCRPRAGPAGANVYEHAVYGSDDQLVYLFELTQILEKESSLKGKPKICIIQACRNTDHASKSQNDKLDAGVGLETFGDYESDSEESTDSESEDFDLSHWYKYDSENEGSPKPEHDTKPKGTPTEHVEGTETLESVPIHCPKDFLIVHPVQPHKISFRWVKYGSCFVWSMFQHRKMLKKVSVLTFLTEVAGAVAKMKYPYKKNGEEGRYKMCVTLMHRLQSDVAFCNSKYTRVAPVEVK